MREYLAFVPAALLAAIVLIFVLVPNAVAILSFTGVLFLKGEVWRLLTFPLAHVSSSHLIENGISLIVASLLAHEVGISPKEYLWAFAAAILLVASIELAAFPTLVIVGASASIFAVYGAFAAKGSIYVNRAWLVPILGATALTRYGISAATGQVSTELLVQTLLHAAGFVAGVIVMLLSVWLVKISRPRIFTSVTPDEL